MSYRPDRFDSQSVKEAAANAAEARKLIPAHIADYIDRGITNGLTGAVARIVRNTLPDKILPPLVEQAVNKAVPGQGEIDNLIQVGIEAKLGEVMPTFYQLFNAALEARDQAVAEQVAKQITQSIEQIRWEQRKVVLAEMRLVKAAREKQREVLN